MLRAQSGELDQEWLEFMLRSLRWQFREKHSKVPAQPRTRTTEKHVEMKWMGHENDSVFVMNECFGLMLDIRFVQNSIGHKNCSTNGIFLDSFFNLDLFLTLVVDFTNLHRNCRKYHRYCHVLQAPYYLRTVTESFYSRTTSELLVGGMLDRRRQPVRWKHWSCTNCFASSKARNLRQTFCHWSDNICRLWRNKCIRWCIEGQHRCCREFLPSCWSAWDMWPWLADVWVDRNARIYLPCRSRFCRFRPIP